MKVLPADPYNLIIAGVGGQGNVLISRLLAQMLSRQGLMPVVGETFGVSQRGGAVMSHVRLSARDCLSPQTPAGEAHLVMALEPIEALRVLSRYGNRQVKVLTNTRVVPATEVTCGLARLPGELEWQETLAGLSQRVWFADASAGALTLGNPILANVVLLGALAALAELPLDRDLFPAVCREMMSPEKIPLNLAAFDRGWEIMTRTNSRENTAIEQ
jgi:indolepyruvate ferredoxin oxidoreductase beta subunit